MMDSSEDKDIAHLMEIQSSIEKKMGKQFEELLAGDPHDPLNDIAESLKRQKKEIKELK